MKPDGLLVYYQVTASSSSGHGTHDSAALFKEFLDAVGDLDTIE